MEISYSDLADYFSEKNYTEEEFITDIKNKYKLEETDTIDKKLSSFYRNMKKRWNLANRTKLNFCIKNGDWLSNVLRIDFENTDEMDELPSTSSNSRGRPRKSLDECSTYTKKKKLSKALDDISTPNLSTALVIKYNKEHEKLKADITKAVSVASPARVKRIRESIPTPQQDPIKYEEANALALFMDLGLTKEKYRILRRSLQKHNVNVLPSYKAITLAKKATLPDHVEITETSARVNLQDMMNHTARRILENKSEEELIGFPTSLTLFSKWGCDGSSGQSAYKQKITTEDSGEITDANMFMASIVPLRLKSSSDEYWKNPRPSSVHFCRPLMFQYAKETGALIKSTVNDIKSQIAQIQPTKFKVNDTKVIDVNHEFFLTMIDGKVLNEITETKSTRSCPICKRSQKNFDNVEESVNDEHNYEYGISPLHARIRCMEFILKLAYSLKQDTENIDENIGTKEAEKRRKQEIQTKFREELGLDVDKPKQGFGNTNDGNTSRRFFAEEEVTARITGVDVEVIRRLKVILNVLNCRENINGTKFGAYATETMHLFKEKYPQKQLTPTLHKVLVHGQSIIEYQSLPIGELSEEAQESKNKDYKKYRYQNTCKVSRIRQNEDLFQMLAASSDPRIASLRNIRTQKDLREQYSAEMMCLLEISPILDDSFQEI